MNWTKWKHVSYVTFGLLAAFAGIVYQGSLAGNQVGPGLTFGMLAGLVLVMWSRWRVALGKVDDGDVTTLERVFHAVAGIAGLAMPIVALASGKFAPGSEAFIISGYVSTFLGDLSKTGGVLPVPVDLPKAPLAILILVGVLLAPGRILAQEPTTSDVAPPISFCLPGTFHCMVPDFNLNTVNYDLGAKHWKAGITQIGVGYAFLFYTDQPWSFGAALHGAGQWSQGQPSYFALTPTLVFFKVFEAGASFIFLDGSVEKDLTLGISANAESIMALVTGKNIRARHEEAKASYRARLERERAAADEGDREARRIREAARGTLSRAEPASSAGSIASREGPGTPSGVSVR